MLTRVRVEGIELPKLYIAETKKDAEEAMESGIPFIRWTLGQEALLRQLLRPALEKLFPHILWNDLLGSKNEFETKIVNVAADGDDEFVEAHNNFKPVGNGEVADIADDERIFNRKDDTPGYKKMNIEDYVGDISSSVSIEVLQKLKLLPTFMGNIVDCIRNNISMNMHWREGYTKKLGMPLGNFNSAKQLPNLIILDVSGSIPRGISATMLTLIDTMRTELRADLIITSSHSKFYPYGTELPTPQDLRDEYAYCNESYDFGEILKDHISNKEWGHVISFGDNDTPDFGVTTRKVSNAKVHAVHHYHTTMNDTKTGYAKWCDVCDPDYIEYDTEWCWVIKR